MIDRTNPIPMYLQVKNELEQMIKSGELKSGDRIFSESELCDMYSISRITAKKSLDDLVTDGYVCLLYTSSSLFHLATIWPHSERSPDQVADLDSPLPLCVGVARLQPYQVRDLPDLQLRRILDRDHPFRFRNKTGHGI